MADIPSVRQIIVVDARNQAAANTVSKQVDPIGGEKTFTVGLSPTGTAPPTHFWCSWAMTPAERDALHGGLTGLIEAGRAWEFDAAQSTPAQVLATMGLQTIEWKEP